MLFLYSLNPAVSPAYYYHCLQGTGRDIPGHWRVWEWGPECQDCLFSHGTMGRRREWQEDTASERGMMNQERKERDSSWNNDWEKVSFSFLRLRMWWGNIFNLGFTGNQDDISKQLRCIVRNRYFVCTSLFPSILFNREILESSGITGVWDHQALESHRPWINANSEIQLLGKCAWLLSTLVSLFVKDDWK